MSASKPQSPPRRRPYAELRPREYLTPAEVDRLIKGARKSGRHGHRDGLMILMAYRHGFRPAELVALSWERLDLDDARVDVRRLKNGRRSTQPLGGEQIRALRKLKRLYPKNHYVFQTERGGPLTTSGLRKIVARAGEVAGFPWPVHPHMLRHACGYKLINDGQDLRLVQDYLGHREIRHTVRYTELDAGRFRDFWSD